MAPRKPTAPPFTRRKEFWEMTGAEFRSHRALLLDSNGERSTVWDEPDTLFTRAHARIAERFAANPKYVPDLCYRVALSRVMGSDLSEEALAERHARLVQHAHAAQRPIPGRVMLEHQLTPHERHWEPQGFGLLNASAISLDAHIDGMWAYTSPEVVLKHLQEDSAWSFSAVHAAPPQKYIDVRTDYVALATLGDMGIQDALRLKGYRSFRMSSAGEQMLEQGGAVVKALARDSGADVYEALGSMYWHKSYMETHLRSSKHYGQYSDGELSLIENVARLGYDATLFPAPERGEYRLHYAKIPPVFGMSPEDLRTVAEYRAASHEERQDSGLRSRMDQIFQDRGPAGESAVQVHNVARQIGRLRGP